MEADSSEYTRITVLAAGGLIHYVIPSFPVFNAKLREVKFQWEDEYGKIHVFDGFARHCNLLDHQLPEFHTATTTLLWSRFVYNFIVLHNHQLNNFNLFCKI